MYCLCDGADADAGRALMLSHSHQERVLWAGHVNSAAEVITGRFQPPGNCQQVTDQAAKLSVRLLIQ
jgi:hypothetical protein